MAGYHVIHAGDWRYRPTDAQVDALRALTASHPGAYENITVDLHDAPQVYGGDFTVHCPSCDARVDEWGDWWDAWETSGTEPMVPCGDCGVHTALTTLRYDGAVICRFVIHLTEATDETVQALKTKVERILGMTLSVLQYDV